jgi:hypothetical protein
VKHLSDIRAEARIDARSFESANDPVDDLLMEWRVGRHTHGANVELDHRHDPARPHIFREAAEGCRRLLQIGEHKSAHERVERLLRLVGVEVRELKSDVDVRQRFGAVSGDRNAFGRPLDPKHPTSRTNQLACQDRDVSEAAANVQHGHPRTKAGVAK